MKCRGNRGKPLKINVIQLPRLCAFCPSALIIPIDEPISVRSIILLQKVGQSTYLSHVLHLFRQIFKIQAALLQAHETAAFHQ